MITIKSLVYISDNTGARIGECIKVLGSKHYIGKLADKVVVAIKVARPERKAERHEVYKALILRLKKSTNRTNGLRISFGDNSVILYKKNTKYGELHGSRLFGPVTHELRNGKNIKVLSISATVI